MLQYYVECSSCDEESQVLVSNRSRYEPSFCPLCGEEVNSQLVDGDEEDLD